MTSRARDGTGQQGHTAPRHVWVRVDDMAMPGVLIDWRQVDGAWEAHVIYATGPQAHVQEWVPADLVRPVELDLVDKHPSRVGTRDLTSN